MRPGKKIKRAAEIATVRTLLALARVTPRRVGHRLFGAIGAGAARVFGRDRERAVANLAVAFPEAPEPIRRALAASAFRTLGRNVYEFLRIAGASREVVLERVERIDGMQHFQAAHSRGRGVLVVTGHIGCWEILPAHFVALGYPVSVVARRMNTRSLNKQLVAIRARLDVTTLDRDDNPRRMVEVLRRGETLGVLIDQHTRVAGDWVPFFGRPAYTPTAVAKLALATGAAVVPMGIYLGANGRHVVHVLAPIDVERIASQLDRASAVHAVTAQCSLAVERLVRIDPKQWVWFHHRWRETDPPATAEVAYAAEG